MKAISSARVSDSHSDNRKSKIQNRKWLGLSVIAFALVVVGPVAQAQQPGKIFRIGFLDEGTAAGRAVFVEAFRQELSKLGWTEGKNITVEYRFAEQKPERTAELAADLLRLKISLIVVTGTAVALAAKKATTTLPIIMTSLGIPWLQVWLPVWRGQELMSLASRVFRPT
jgi:putative ABC transport system substrate-binding protein